MRKNLQLKLEHRTGDVFAFIAIWCPDFPPETKTTLEREFDRLVDLIGGEIDRTRSEDSKQWLKACLTETREARRRYENGDRTSGRALIRRAAEHYKNALSRKRIVPRFIVAGAGPAQEIDAGFPT